MHIHSAVCNIHSAVCVTSLTLTLLNPSSIQSQLADDPLPCTTPTVSTRLLEALTPLVSLHPTFPGLSDYGIRKIEGK